VRVRIIDNPESFRGPYPIGRVLPILHAASWDVDLVHRLPEERMADLVAEAVASGVELIVGGGGDGTLRDLAEAVADTRLRLGVLPGGTANVFANDAGIPSRPESAARALVRGNERPVDLGRLIVPGHRALRFLLMAGLGLDAASIGATRGPLKRRVGPLAIALGILSAVPGFRPFGLQVVADGQQAWGGRAWQVLASNSPLYANLVRPSPLARADDGLLDLAILPLMGRPVHFRGRAFELRPDGPLRAQLDGTAVIGPIEEPIRIEIEPAALRMRLPPPELGSAFSRPSEERAPGGGPRPVPR
jgi:diacylglycerol kinase family enzyme